MDRSHITNARILANALRLPISDETDAELARQVLDGCVRLSGRRLDVRGMTALQLADLLDAFTDKVEIQERQMVCN